MARPPRGSCRVTSALGEEAKLRRRRRGGFGEGAASGRARDAHPRARRGHSGASRQSGAPLGNPLRAASSRPPPLVTSRLSLLAPFRLYPTAIRVPQRARGGARDRGARPPADPGSALVGHGRQHVRAALPIASMTTRAACWRASARRRWRPWSTATIRRILQNCPAQERPGGPWGQQPRPAAASGDCTAAWPGWPTCSTTSRRAPLFAGARSATCARQAPHRHVR